MTLREFCRDHAVTPEEGRALVLYLATLRTELLIRRFQHADSA